MDQIVLFGLLGTLLTWGVTAAGAALVFVFSAISEKVLNALFAMAAGVMIASSCFGLIEPALETAEESFGSFRWAPVVAGILVAYVFFVGLDTLLHRFLKESNQTDLFLEIDSALETKKNRQRKKKDEKIDGKVKKNGGKNILRNRNPGKSNIEKTAKMGTNGEKNITNKIILILSAITAHNLPEGLAVGIAFGSIRSCANDECVDKLFKNAVVLTLGIALQNFPEGIAVAFPLRKCGMSPFKSFWYGQMSAVVEPIGALLGAVLTLQMKNLQPYFLSFAAGAMLFVTVSEMIPEAFSSNSKSSKMANNFAFVGGFALMMVLEGVFE
ncbi:hypothetical protein MHBO_001832 [Bonamia ostreae]|uniref:Zinc transporter ZIP11 n=1 Tax=Bonamia ostreae TaxID=126728 RepID=A0ABV2AKB4_9EUKA